MTKEIGKLIENLFCDKSEQNKLINEPFNFEEHSYYSNGKAIIRGKKNNNHISIESMEKKYFNMFLNVKKIFDEIDFNNENNFINLDLSMIDNELDDCEECEGTGILKNITCPECQGEKEVHFKTEYSEYRIDCALCKEQGVISLKQAIKINETHTEQVEVECLECKNGKKEDYRTFKKIKINNNELKINLSEINKLKQLPNLVFSNYKNEKFNILVFKFNDYEGFLTAI